MEVDSQEEQVVEEAVDLRMVEEVAGEVHMGEMGE